MEQSGTRRDGIRDKAALGLALLLVAALLIAQSSPANAFKPFTHAATGDAVLADVLDDGAVTLGGRAYSVPERVAQSITNHPDAFAAGTVGPDGFPDLVFGQSVVHPGETGQWLAYLLEQAWEVQERDAAYTDAEQQRVLAFTYGYLLHAAGDVWSHTLVNELSAGTFPEVTDTLTDAQARDIALRHIIVEGYIGDATPGYDGNPDVEAVDTDGDGRTDDVSTDSTPAVPLDAPIEFLYRSMVNPYQVLPVGTCADGVDDDGDGVADDGCPSGPWTVGDGPEPVRGGAIDYFLDLQADLQVLRAQLQEDADHSDCLSEDPDCEQRTRSVEVPTVRGTAEVDVAEQVCVGATIGCLPDPDDAATDLTYDLAIVYLDAWIDDLRTGLERWPELGLAVSRALFDPQTRRDAQNDLCSSRGDEGEELRRRCEEDVSKVDTVLWATKGFRNDHLLSMLGAPDVAGDVLDALDDIAGVLDDVLGPALNPVRLTMDELRELAKEKVLEILEERFLVDVDTVEQVLEDPATLLVEGEVTVRDGVTVDLFDDADHARLDEVLGLVTGHHGTTSTDEPRPVLGGDAEFDPWAFAPFRNAVTMGKLALLDGPTLDQVLSDLVGEPVSYYQRFPHANVMTVGGGSTVTGSGDLVPGPVSPITLTEDSDQVRIDGEDADDRTSGFVRVGDMNGDGVDEYAIGSSGAEPSNGDPGAVTILTGPPSASFRLGSADAPETIRLSGSGLARAGGALAPAGDVNGDGYADLLVGAPGWRTSPFVPIDGRAYVVLGGPDLTDRQLSALDDTSPEPWGYRVEFPERAGGGAVGRIDGAGDVNGDGYDDLVLGAPTSTQAYGSYGAFVVYGGTATDPVDLNDFPAEGRGLVIVGFDAGHAVAGLGDLNGDGFDDVAVTNANDRRAYVVYGGIDNDRLYLYCLDTEASTRQSCVEDYPDMAQGGYLIRGDDAYLFSDAKFDHNYYFGADVAGPGDLTGDGVPDIAITAGSMDGSDRGDQGRGLIYVVPGRARSANLVLPENDVMRILAPSGTWDAATTADLRGAGDVDGDGFDDLAIASTEVREGTDPSVAMYATVVFGRDPAEGGLDIDADTFGAGSPDGFVVSGPALTAPGEPAFWAQPWAGGVGDLDGDALDDLAVGFPDAAPDGQDEAGSVHLIRSPGRPLIADPGGGEVEVKLEPWLGSIDADHAWRADGLPVFDRLSGGHGNFPLWESCALRGPVFQDPGALFVDWENPGGNFPDLGDAPSIYLDGLTTAASETCNLDGDAIHRNVDGWYDGGFVDESDMTSTRFTDQHRGGTTFGEIMTTSGEVRVGVEDADKADRGVVLRPFGGDGEAQLSICNEPAWDVLLQASDVGVATCGSLTLETLAGSLTVLLDGDWRVEVGEDAAVHLEETAGAVTVTNTMSGTGSVTITGPDGEKTTLAPGGKQTIGNVPPTIESVVPTHQQVAYSDEIAQMAVTASDIDSTALTLATTGLPDGVTVATGPDCTTGDSGMTTCTWGLSGAVTDASGTYPVDLTVSDDAGGSTTTDGATIEVVPEDADLTPDPSNPTSVLAEPSGEATVTLRVGVADTEPDLPAGRARPGDPSEGTVTVHLTPVGPGTSYDTTCTNSPPVGTGYDAEMTATCTFDAVAVNGYQVEYTLAGEHYTGSALGLVTVADPADGGVSGGGSFAWPGAASTNASGPADRTTFGVTAGYQGAEEALQGSVTLTRHLTEGGEYRLRSTQLTGLAVGETPDFGWVVVVGTASYRGPDTRAVPGYQFVLYLEDHDESGRDTDRLWLSVVDADGATVAEVTMPTGAPLTGGNVATAPN